MYEYSLIKESIITTFLKIILCPLNVDLNNLHFLDEIKGEKEFFLKYLLIMLFYSLPFSF